MEPVSGATPWFERPPRTNVSVEPHMDPMDWLENHELLRFFRRHKTEMSCMEKPHTFLRQLRDHDLVPEDRYKKVSCMRSKDNMRDGLYEILDWFETERSQKVREFWSCVFKDSILNQYPTLRLLRNSLMDGSFHFDISEKVGKEESDKEKRKALSDSEKEEEEEEEQEKSVTKKRKLGSRSVCRNDNEEEPAGPSSQLTPRKRSKKLCFSTPRKKGKENNIWSWPFFKLQLPVTCGDRKGTLDRQRLAKVSSGDEEEEEDRDLDELDRVSSSSKESSPAVPDEEREERAEQQPQASHDKRMFKVTCGASDGTFYKNRFVSGTRGKSIRTETSWMTPVEFLELALGRKDASWKKDIECEGKPLFVLIKAETLTIHSLLCNCNLCKPDDEDQRNQKNDDECCICRREGDLVMCDNCPRSFHKKCHLPHVENGLLRDNSPWFCTFCVFRSNEHYFGSEELESALSYNISQRMLQCQCLLLCLWSADEEQIFAANPCRYLNNYSKVIETPMWFGHIAGKLQQKLYQTVGEFVTDVRLIFSNCALYNRKNAEVLVIGKRLKELFDRKFKSVFNIKRKGLEYSNMPVLYHSNKVQETVLYHPII
uniref:nuclear body protein SP140-like protein isoform X4 n=1 Tax=Gasterosteus aculeatus aculeatus TaxID=481459 RepID=UPI001A988232|nr:nuclear body protein SP140-like protein isoform X4 [Gasterosteus aculeatus aculeatus]